MTAASATRGCGGDTRGEPQRRRTGETMTEKKMKGLFGGGEAMPPRGLTGRPDRQRPHPSALHVRKACRNVAEIKLHVACLEIDHRGRKAARPCVCN